MDLWQLHIFCKVIELEGFSKAAADIHLSQPTVSSHIKDLEEHFNCRLIDRIEKKAIPTQAGRILFTHAKKILQARDGIEIAMADFHGKLSGSLCLGGSTIPGNFMMPVLIGEFRGLYPDVSISLSVSDTQSTIESIVSGTIELGIVGAVSRNKSIAQLELIKDDLKLIIPGNHKWAERKRIPLASVFQEPFIIRQKGSGTLKSIYDSLSEKGVKREQLRVVAEMGSTTAVIQGIKQNVGISILSPIAVREELENGSLKAISVSGLKLRRSIYLTYHSGRSQSPICKSFVSYIIGKYK